MAAGDLPVIKGIIFLEICWPLSCRNRPDLGENLFAPTWSAALCQRHLLLVHLVRHFTVPRTLRSLSLLAVVRAPPHTIQSVPDAFDQQMICPRRLTVPCDRTSRCANGSLSSLLEVQLPPESRAKGIDGPATVASHPLTELLACSSALRCPQAQDCRGATSPALRLQLNTGINTAHRSIAICRYFWG